ncbi:MAG: hypothetical protein EPN30_07485 [Actinomycetota bacterium]|nr:MAG: hypothetical protein EPN30_07485 [Actinomycetota bacterium]
MTPQIAASNGSSNDYLLGRIVPVYARILAILTFAIGDMYLAEDVVDEAFVRAYDKWERVRSLELSAGWTHQVALNLVRQRSNRMIRKFGPPTSSPDEPTASLGVNEIWKIASNFPKRQHEVVVFRYIGNLTEATRKKACGIASRYSRRSRFRHHGTRRNVDYDGYLMFFIK